VRYQANKTDLEFLKERASSLHFEILVADKTLIFRKAESLPRRSIRYLWAHSQKSFASGCRHCPQKADATQYEKPVIRWNTDPMTTRRSRLSWCAGVRGPALNGRYAGRHPPRRTESKSAERA
jgi:hypothetical protein